MKARVRTTMGSSCPADIVPGHSAAAEVAPIRVCFRGHFLTRKRSLVQTQYRPPRKYRSEATNPLGDLAVLIV